MAGDNLWTVKTCLSLMSGEQRSNKLQKSHNSSLLIDPNVEIVDPYSKFQED